MSPVVTTPEKNDRNVLWPRHSTVLQALDVPRLLHLAEHEGAHIQLCVVPGETIFDRDRVAVVTGGQNLPDAELLAAFSLGSERTFDQDPALARRLLADIALRALSPAINDPTTAVQSLDVLTDLLRILVGRDLGLEVVDGADRTPRVVVKLLTWEDYVCVALDEIIAMGSGSGQVQRHLVRLLEGLVAIAPAQHREPIERRLAMVTAATRQSGSNPPSGG
jgi:uncharacterized membrane protein